MIEFSILFSIIYDNDNRWVEGGGVKLIYWTIRSIAETQLTMCTKFIKQIERKMVKKETVLIVGYII